MSKGNTGAVSALAERRFSASSPFTASGARAFAVLAFTVPRGKIVEIDILADL
jgi:hypothetical protein